MDTPETEAETAPEPQAAPARAEVAPAPEAVPAVSVDPWCGDHSATFQQWLRDNIAGGPIGRDTAMFNALFDALPALAKLLSTPGK